MLECAFHGMCSIWMIFSDGNIVASASINTTVAVIFFSFRFFSFLYKYHGNCWHTHSPIEYQQCIWSRPSHQTILNNSKHWSFDETFKYNRMESNIEAYPFRVFRSGARGSLHVITKALENNFDRFCTGATPGFRMILHAPYELPNSNHRHIVISNNRSTNILIKPKIIRPSSNLDVCSPDERKCFFQSERKLKYFKIYTQINCFAECGWNKTLKDCGCISIGMQRKWGKHK